MKITGVDNAIRTLDLVEDYWQAAMDAAAVELAEYLEEYAKLHHNTTPRKGAVVYPSKGMRFYRPAGIGWGSITGRTQMTTHGRVIDRARTFVTVALSAGMDYDVFLELLHSSKWSWIWPAVAESGPQMFKIMEKHFRLP